MLKYVSKKISYLKSTLWNVYFGGILLTSQTRNVLSIRFIFSKKRSKTGKKFEVIFWHLEKICFGFSFRRHKKQRKTVIYPLEVSYVGCAAAKFLTFERLLLKKNEKKSWAEFKMKFFFQKPIFNRLKYRFFV